MSSILQMLCWIVIGKIKWNFTSGFLALCLMWLTQKSLTGCVAYYIHKDFLKIMDLNHELCRFTLPLTLLTDEKSQKRMTESDTEIFLVSNLTINSKSMSYFWMKMYITLINSLSIKPFLHLELWISSDERGSLNGTSFHLCQIWEGLFLTVPAYRVKKRKLTSLTHIGGKWLFAEVIKIFWILRPEIERDLRFVFH